MKKYIYSIIAGLLAVLCIYGCRNNRLEETGAVEKKHESMNASVPEDDMPVYENTEDYRNEPKEPVLTVQTDAIEKEEIEADAPKKIEETTQPHVETKESESNSVHENTTNSNETPMVPGRG